MATVQESVDAVDEKRRFELLMMEYNHMVQRYEHLYRAVWQNFSYMSAVAAAFVAFGSANIPWQVLISLATLPWVFWFFATYRPLDSYGNKIRARLAFREKDLNHRYFGEPEVTNEDRGEQEPATEEGGEKETATEDGNETAVTFDYVDEKIGRIRLARNLGHWQRFHELGDKPRFKPGRVNTWVRVFGFGVTVVFLSGLFLTCGSWSDLTNRRQDPQRIEILDPRFDSLQQSVDSILRMLTAIADTG